MALEPGIENLFHLAMLAEIVGDHASALVVLLHADGQRLDAAQYQPTFEWRQDRPDGLLHECQFLSLILRGAHQNAADSVTMAIQELRSCMQHHVSTEFD